MGHHKAHVVSRVSSPIIGFVVGFIAMKIVLWRSCAERSITTMRCFRAGQRFSSAAMAGPGIRLPQKTMGIISLSAWDWRLRQGPQHPRSRHG